MKTKKTTERQRVIKLLASIPLLPSEFGGQKAIDGYLAKMPAWYTKAQALMNDLLDAEKAEEVARRKPLPELPRARPTRADKEFLAWRLRLAANHKGLDIGTAWNLLDEAADAIEGGAQ